MRRIAGILTAVLLLAAALAGGAAESDQLKAPDFVMEGFDGGSANHDWETNLFFQRMQEKTGISFEFRQRTDEEQWTERKKEIVEGTDLPDVLFKAGLTDEETMKMAESGILLDLEPLRAEYAPDLWSLLEANPAWMAAVTLPDGTIRALPCINELAPNNLIWINRSWLNTLKKEMPSTAEELTEVLRAFREGDPNRNGRADEIPLSVLGMWDLRFLGHAFGITDNDYYLRLQDGKVTSSLTSEENRAFLEWLHGLWEEELLGHTSFSTADPLRQITDSKAAIPYGMFLSNSPLTVVPSEAMDQYTALTPLEYSGKRVYRDLLGPLTKGTFALTRTCREPERMLTWVNSLYTEAGSILMQAGEEGKEYRWTEDGTWEWMDDLQTVASDILPGATLSDGGIAPGIVKKDFQQKYQDASTQSLIEDMSRVQQYTLPSFPPVYLTAEDRAEVAALQAEIAPWAEKRMAEFVTGDTELNDASWTEFVQEAERRGLNRMAALWQKYFQE